MLEYSFLVGSTKLISISILFYYLDIFQIKNPDEFFQTEYSNNTLISTQTYEKVGRIIKTFFYQCHTSINNIDSIRALII